jgi:hypothetical protein
MLAQVDEVLGQLNRLFGDANRLTDEYCLLVQQRDGPNQPLPSIRQWLEDRAERIRAVDLRAVLQIIRHDLQGSRPAPANAAPSAAPEFHLDSGVTADLSPREAARQLKERRK